MRSLKAKLEKLRQAAALAGEPIPEEVAAAMIHHGETGQWPRDASPRTIELAEALRKASRDIMGCC